MLEDCWRKGTGSKTWQEKKRGNELPAGSLHPAEARPAAASLHASSPFCPSRSHSPGMSSSADESFAGTPFSLWQPALPLSLERRLPDYGLTIAFYRFARLAWVLFTIPLHLILVMLALLLPRPLQPPQWLLKGDQQRWTCAQRLALPLVKRAIWAITDVGGAPRLSPQQERRWIAWLVQALEVAYQDGGDDVRLAVEDCNPGDEGWHQRWHRDEAVDPTGVVQPSAVPMFWFDARVGSAHVAGGARGSRRATDGEGIVLYFVGGGYCYGELSPVLYKQQLELLLILDIAGSPTEGNRCFILAKRTGLVIVGAHSHEPLSLRPSD